MKKVMSTVLATLLAISLFACSNGTTSTATSSSSSPGPSLGTAPNSTSTATANGTSSNASPNSSNAPVELGFYDPSRDYSKNKQYSVVHMMSTTGVLYQAMDDAFKKWCDRLNCKFTSFSANGDNDLFVSTLETYSDQKIDGFLLDADTTIYPRVIDLCNEKKLNWMPDMGKPIDADGNLGHVAVQFDNTQFGIDMANWLIDYAKKTWSDATGTNMAMVSVDYSVVPSIHERTVGSQTIWEKNFPDQTSNFMIVDAITGKMDTETGYNLISATMAANPDIKYWLIAAATDDLADGSGRAAESAKKDSNTVIITCGGQSLIDQWDKGYDGSWKAAIFSGTLLYAEPMVCGLYAMMEDKATAETLWPEWINHSDGDKFASLIVPSVTLTKDNYQEFLAWQDQYTGIKAVNYPYHGTQFNPRGTPPTTYAGS